MCIQKRILSIGEILWDILPTETVLGGAPFNFAYRVNSLGNKVIFVSRLGRDTLGKKAFDVVSSLRIDTSFLQWDEGHPTGTVQVSFDKYNNPDYLIIPDVAYDYVEMTDILEKTAQSTDCLCFGTLVQRAPVTYRTVEELLALSRNILKILDINLRKRCYNMDTVVSSINKADILKLNEDEVRLVGDMLNIPYSDILCFCEEMIEKWKLKCCVVTLGKNGAFVISKDNEKTYVPGYKVDVVDTLGSGDAFTAGFIHAYLQGQSLNEACSLGNILGAVVATQKGATQPIYQETIDNFKNKRHERLFVPGLKRFIQSM